MAFYDPKGNKINIDEFIKIYSEGYFLENEKVPGFSYSQTSGYVENEIIIPILNGHIDDNKDFARIMAWKIGKIKHADSENESRVIYAEDWTNCETENPMRYGKVMDIHRLANYIIDNRECLEKMAIENPQECIRLLRNKNTSGIGSVYLITILFFLSHGEMPIYDRFAMASLIACEGNLKPNIGNEIELPKIPGKWEPGFSSLVEDIYVQYIDSLNKLGVNYKEDRNLDRALWVYGHGFKTVY